MSLRNIRTNLAVMKKLIQKLINNTISKEEYDVLMELLKKDEHSGEVEKMMDEYWFNPDDLENEQKDPSEKLFSKITDRIQEEDEFNSASTKNRIQILYRVAAVFVIAASSLFIYQEYSEIKNDGSSNISYPADAITLTFENGTIKTIQENDQRQIVDSKGNVIGTQMGDKLRYNDTDTKENPSKKPIYNTLTVPYGKRFDLALSDGTQIMLNAGSSLKYPVQFVNGQERKVFLNGEAYFDVAEDKAHPFVVNANDIDVEVLGTEFNVSYYPEDPHINTVLVEGSVQLNSTGNNPVFLEPGYLAQWDKDSESMVVEKVEIDLHTAWKDGILLFRKTPFSSIRKKLERYFDVPIESNNAFLEEQTYTASFTYESLYDILETFQEDVPFEYEVLDEKILIKQTFNSKTKTNANEAKN